MTLDLSGNALSGAYDLTVYGAHGQLVDHGTETLTGK